MNADEARLMLKVAIDPSLLLGLTGTAALGAGLAMRRAAKNRAAQQEIRAWMEGIGAELNEERLHRRNMALGAAGIAGASAAAGFGAAKLTEKHKKSASHEENRKKLHHLVAPIAKRIPYKTKGAQGWDVMVDAVLSGDPGTAAGK